MPEPEKCVFHLVTSKLNFRVMNVWFLLNSIYHSNHSGNTIESDDDQNSEPFLQKRFYCQVIIKKKGGDSFRKDTS